MDNLLLLNRLCYKAGDALQYLAPAAVAAIDIIPDVMEGNYMQAAVKTIGIAGVILAQNRITVALKYAVNKERPNGRDHYSFPSGHMMIMATSATRVFTQTDSMLPRALVGIATSVVGWGKYSSGDHDAVDLTAGALGGWLLGQAWNYVSS